MYGDQENVKEERVNRIASTEARDTCGASRATARGVLYEKVARLRSEANQLEALARAVPDNFPADAELGLFTLAVKAL